MKTTSDSFQPKSHDKYIAVIGLIIAIILSSIPFIVNDYILGIMFSIILFGTLAGSWNILSGYTDYISFGHVAFFGVGAYASSIFITSINANVYVAILLGGIIALVISLPVAMATLRLQDMQFSITTLAFSEILLASSQTFESITQGTRGLVVSVEGFLINAYLLLLLVFILTTVASYLISRSYLGLALTAIQDDEEAAEAVGVNTNLYKLIAFSLSALFPGFAGAIASLYWQYINPTTVFDPLLSGDMMIMAVLGGRGTVLGPIIGSSVLTPIRSETQASFPYLHGIVFGLLFLIFVLLIPEGAISKIKDLNMSRITRVLRTTLNDD